MDGGYALTVNTGGVTVIHAASVTTTGAQTFNDAVTLAVDTALTGSAHAFGSISVTGTTIGLRSVRTVDSQTYTRRRPAR